MNHWIFLRHALLAGPPQMGATLNERDPGPITITAPSLQFSPRPLSCVLSWRRKGARSTLPLPRSTLCRLLLLPSSTPACLTPPRLSCPLVVPSGWSRIMGRRRLSVLRFLTFLGRMCMKGRPLCLCDGATASMVLVLCESMYRLTGHGSSTWVFVVRTLPVFVPIS